MLAGQVRQPRLCLVGAEMQDSSSRCWTRSLDQVQGLPCVPLRRGTGRHGALHWLAGPARVQRRARLTPAGCLRSRSRAGPATLRPSLECLGCVDSSQEFQDPGINDILFYFIKRGH